MFLFEVVFNMYVEQSRNSFSQQHTISHVLYSDRQLFALRGSTFAICTLSRWEYSGSLQRDHISRKVMCRLSEIHLVLIRHISVSGPHINRMWESPANRSGAILIQFTQDFNTTSEMLWCLRNWVGLYVYLLKLKSLSLSSRSLLIGT